MANTIQQLIKNFDKIERQRTLWIRFSIIVVLLLAIIILDWSHIVNNNKHLWFIFSLGIVLSATWWYWTMRLVKIIITTKKELLNIMLELTSNITETRSEILKRRQHKD
jgi:predicted cation transporter